MSDAAIEFAQNLIRCKSVTPLEGGALDYLERVLSEGGFACTRLPFSDADTPDVDNLYARFGTGTPHLMFAGHTDVVPPGDESLWCHPPFEAVIHNDTLYGRGAADMKGGIACFLAAALDYVKRDDFKGSLSFLITGDEEGPAINGTVKMLDWLKQNDEIPDHALVGEPTNPSHVGEAIKIGRRGSLNGWLTVTGKQGHVAYPHLASNPIDGIALAMVALKEEPLDDGNDYFLPSHLEITSVDVGNETVNVIPSSAKCHFNVRFNDEQTAEGLEDLLQGKIRSTLENSDLHFELKFQRSADCFVTEPGPWIETLTRSIKEITGISPSLSTSGGTSDARFIKDICPVVELGLSNATIHQIDEQVPLKDMAQLTEIYAHFIDHYFNG